MEVTFYDDYLLVAADWAGLQVLHWDGSTLTHAGSLNLDEKVRQISVWRDVAILSCESDECYIVDISDPTDPRFDQFLATGYLYRTQVVGDRVYAATREGVKIYSIGMR